LTGIVEIAAFLLWLKTPFSTKYIVKKEELKQIALQYVVIRGILELS